jgi:ABC-type thiamine transport system ATPase subunit
LAVASHDRVAEARHLVELTGYEARAVVYQPDVVLLDEPFSNLDAKLRKSMRLEVRKLQQPLALTTVFVHARPAGSIMVMLLIRPKMARREGVT